MCAALGRLTRKRAIELHRQMWRMIAEETERTHQIPSKQDTIEKMGYNPESVDWYCFCCHYAYRAAHRDAMCRCAYCPLKWPLGECSTQFRIGLFDQWVRARVTDNWEQAVLVARKIAELPESN